MSVREAAQAFVNHLTSPDSEEPSDGSWQPYWTTHGRLLDALIAELAKPETPWLKTESGPHFRPMRDMYRRSMDWVRDRADEATEGKGEWSLTTEMINDLAVDAYTARVDAQAWRADTRASQRQIASLKDAVGHYVGALKSILTHADDAKGRGLPADWVATQCESALRRGNEVLPPSSMPAPIDTGLGF